MGKERWSDMIQKTYRQKIEQGIWFWRRYKERKKDRGKINREEVVMGGHKPYYVELPKDKEDEKEDVVRREVKHEGENDEEIIKGIRMLNLKKNGEEVRIGN